MANTETSTCTPDRDTASASPPPLGPFASLVPLNRDARERFSSAVQTILDNPDQWERARNNLRWEHNRHESVSTTSVFSDAEDVAQETTVYAHPAYIGEYLFQLDHPPRQGAWILGDGRGSFRTDVDFLLTAPHTSRAIAGRHALIYHDKRTRRLLLRANHKVIAPSPSNPGTSIMLNRKSDPQTMELVRRHELRIGTCTYLFDYTDAATSTQYSVRLGDFMRKIYGEQWQGINSLTPGLLSVTPDEQSMRFGKYSWPIGAFAEGTFGQVVAGTTISGEAIAVKRLKFPNGNDLAKIQKVMAHLQGHSFIRLTHQYFAALAYMHEERHTMHRDIKPSNLGVQHLEPSHGVLLDLDDAIAAESSTDHQKGTIAYLSPEVVAMKDPSLKIEFSTKWGVEFTESYGPENDNWALAMSIYHVYFRKIHRTLTTPQLVEFIREDIQRESEANSSFAPLGDVLLALLVVDRSQRMSASMVARELLLVLEAGQKRGISEASDNNEDTSAKMLSSRP
ncbi:hypothetical protein H2204_002985 [Knufia peltigerae]|uniref:Protein kinase domain-containing protein n=1 Tax=Knufia peltigerae TaxID=1002370 RepID=A0AA39D048_9EURO|nr:hypothetical protein H2204_002985 [Knufia peltigerae]